MKNRFTAIKTVLTALCMLLVMNAFADSFSSVQCVIGKDEVFPKIQDPAEADSLFVYFLGIGAQDSFLIVSGGKTMLVDCGKFPTGDDVYRNINALEVNHIDYAVLTHPHDDHAYGFMTLFENDITVGDFYIFHDRDYNAEMIRLMKYLDEKGINVLDKTASDDISFGGNKIDLYRYPYSNIRPEMTNCSSLVMKVSKGERSVLLCADITESEENRLAEEYGQAIKADIVKLAHHGITVPQWKFINLMDADFYVLTNNYSNVPEESQLRMEQMELTFASTTNGTICCVTDGSTWRVKQEKLTEK